MLGCVLLVSLAGTSVEAQVISYRIHSDILTELQDRYPEHATDYWNDIRDAIRDGINDWAELNPGLVFTPSHDDTYDVTIEWIDSSRAWGVEYHDRHGANRIGIDFDDPEPDAYGASLLNPDIIRYIMAHELGHVLGIGHSAEEDHLMHGLANPNPDKVFNDMGYTIPAIHIENYANVGGNKLDIAFHMQGYHIYDVETMDVNGTHYLVVATGEDGIYAINMTDPDNPSLAGSYDIDTEDTESLDGWPYLAALHGDGIAILDMSNPYAVTLAGTIDGTLSQYAMMDLVWVDGTVALVTTMGHGHARQYDVTHHSNIHSSGAYYDDFALPARGIQVAIRDDIPYAVVDVGLDGILVLRISVDNSLTKMNQHTFLSYDGTIRATVHVNEDEYRIAYWNGQILVHEGTGQYSSDPVGRLLGYTVHEIDTMKVNGHVYAVIAAGNSGVLGIHIGDEAAGKWTFNCPLFCYMERVGVRGD